MPEAPRASFGMLEVVLSQANGVRISFVSFLFLIVRLQAAEYQPDFNLPPPVLSNCLSISFHGSSDMSLPAESSLPAQESSLAAPESILAEQKDSAKTELPWIGLDIGGANIKGAHTVGWARSLAFPLWKQPHALGAAIANLLESAPPFSGVALTMTGELADCFPTRAIGVASILEQTTSILPASMVKVYGVQGNWYTVSQAARDPWMVAASNWHALASFVGELTRSKYGLVIDIGSTTTDLIPLRDGKVAIDTYTDSQRLQCGALVYTGIERSNVSAISQRLPLFGSWCPVINEWFASARDVHVWLGDLPEDPEDCETADGRPATREAARYRLARLVGEDGSTLADADIDALALQARQDQAALIGRGMQQVVKYEAGLFAAMAKKPKRSSSSKADQRLSGGDSAEHLMQPDQVVVCGHGGFLIEDALRSLGWNMERTDWSQTLGSEVSRCGPAYAVAKLAQRSFRQSVAK